MRESSASRPGSGNRKSELDEGVVAVGVAEDVAFLAGEGEDVFAGDDGGAGVLVVAGAEVGMLQLEVLGVDDVARQQTVAHEE